MSEKIINFFISDNFIVPILVIVLGSLTYKIIKKIIIKTNIKSKNELDKKRRNTIISLLLNIIKYIIIIIGLIIILEVYGINTFKCFDA